MQSTQIKGLTYIQDFITPEEEAVLVQHIDASPWLGDLRRRVQHYGYKYDYKARAIDHSMRIGELPAWCDALIDRLKENNIYQERPDQLIINEYLPGQGIAPHVDCVPCFKETIVSISLLSDIIMDFSQRGRKIPQLLHCRSVVVMDNDCRYYWRHGIASRKSDMIDGFRQMRSRRVSLTFRRVILK